VAVVSSGSVGSAVKAAHAVARYWIDLTAERSPMKAPLASVSWNWTG
jgi:hypothetical protein